MNNMELKLIINSFIGYLIVIRKISYYRIKMNDKYIERQRLTYYYLVVRMSEKKAWLSNFLPQLIHDGHTVRVGFGVSILDGKFIQRKI